MQDFKKYSDNDLYAEVRKNSKSAFQEIFERYWFSLYQSCYAVIKSHEEAEEIVQELLVVIWDKRDSLVINNLSAYLFAAVRKRIIDHVRARITREKYWTYYRQFIPTYGEVTEEMVSFGQLQDEVQQILSTLPEKSQRVFVLNRLEGRSVSEISKLLHMSTRTIEYHLNKSLNLLRARLKNSLISD